MKQLTVGFPVFNEGRLAAEFLANLDEALSPLADYKVDAVVVNDGCTDDSIDHLRKIPLKKISQVTLINLARNYGHPRAVQCLVEHMNSPLNVIMDADFQDDPHLIAVLVQQAERSGVDVVRVARSRQGGGALLRVLFFGFRRIYRFLTGEKHSFGTYGLYSSRALQALRAFTKETHFYFPGVVSLIGLKAEVISEPRLPRRSGSSRVGFKRLFKLAFDAFFSFSALPIRLASFFGFVITFLSLAGMCVIVYLRLFTQLTIPGWSSILSAVTFFGGVQLLFLGVLGEYVARIFEQVKGRPPYFVESTSVLCSSDVPAPR